MNDTLNSTAPTGDISNGDASTAAAPPKKKRTFFKKAAWQTAPKAENDDDTDIFSHRKEFTQVLAEENRLKREKRKKEEAERKRKEDDEEKRKQEEKRERKRRKISLEAEDAGLRRSGSTPESHRKGIERRSRSPLSPISIHADPSSLSARYDSLTKSSSSQLPSKSTVIDLGDDSDEEDSADETYVPPTTTARHAESIPLHPPKPAPSDPPDDLDAGIDDPELAAVLASARAQARAQARAAAAKEPTLTPSISESSSQKKDDGPIVELFVTSEIPNTAPLRIKARANNTLGKMRLGWCGKQGFTEDFTKEVFLTWKLKKVFDSTKITRLGIQVDEYGGVTMENAPGLYDEKNPPKIHIEAWTEDIFKEHKRKEAEEAAAARGGLAVEVEEEEEVMPEPEPEPEVAKFRLTLMAKGKPDFKIAVKATTTIEQLASAYKQKTGTPEDQPITLMFDGERLRPMDTIADTDIEDMEAVEVYFK